VALHFFSPLPELITPMTFVHVPKTGGTSFTKWVVDNKIPHDNQAMHASLEKIKNIWQDPGYTFAFVRNPYDRLVSYFNYVGQQAQNKLQMLSQGLEPKKRIDPEIELSIFQDYCQGFNHWLTREYHRIPTAMNTDKTFQNWRRTQTWWVNGCNRIMRAENLQTEFGWIQTYFRVSADLPRVNISQHNDYRHYYNSETRAIVQQMYGEDLDRFGYVF
jgi:chondroitin 4-sulfotransferase 11